MAKSKTTKESKVATTIVESVNDFDLDLDSVGMYVAQMSSSTLYNRLDVLMDSAREYKENDYNQEYHYERIRNI